MISNLEKFFTGCLHLSIPWEVTDVKMDEGQEHPELPSGDRNCLWIEGVPPGHLGFHEQVRCGQPSCGMAGGSHEHRHRSIERYPQIGRQPLQRDTELVQFGYEQRCDGRDQQRYPGC